MSARSHENEIISDLQCPFYKRSSKKYEEIACELMPGVNNVLRFERETVRQYWIKKYCTQLKGCTECPHYKTAMDMYDD